MTKRARAVGLLVGVFLIGGIFGSAATFAFAQRDMRGLMGREGFERRRMKAMTRELDLSAEQQTKIQQILSQRGDERRKLMDSMQEQCGKPLSEHREKTDADIRALLTAEQKTKFEKLLERRTRFRDGKHRGRRH